MISLASFVETEKGEKGNWQQTLRAKRHQKHARKTPQSQSGGKFQGVENVLFPRLANWQTFTTIQSGNGILKTLLLWGQFEVLAISSRASCFAGK